MTGFLEAMPEAATGLADWANALPRVNEAITVPTQVRPAKVRVSKPLCAVPSSLRMALASSLRPWSVLAWVQSAQYWPLGVLHC